MSLMKDIYLQTSTLIDFLKEFPEGDEERDLFLGQLNQRLEERERIIKQMEGQPLSEQEKKLGHELIKLNKKLTERMEQIQTIIRANLAQLEKKKESGLKYENPYEGPTSDGVFFDQQG